jgi:hypothetical protein
MTDPHSRIARDFAIPFGAAMSSNPIAGADGCAFVIMTPNDVRAAGPLE